MTSDEDDDDEGFCSVSMKPKPALPTLHFVFSHTSNDNDDDDENGDDEGMYCVSIKPKPSLPQLDG